uniref:EOG090X0BAY n=1 Tax=Eubosmina coregoni TaxID=186181 RepID=A0A4Y7LQ13_9CRUS|nr:EOG090X0BAY [Eubosmina coregoni]SVE69992.1 EOG090X0BAY [Eubosmina coregoni]
MTSVEGSLKKRKSEEKLSDQESKKIRNEYSAVRDDQRPICKYKEKCYQKNAYHLSKYRHPHREGVSNNEDTLQKLNLEAQIVTGQVMKKCLDGKVDSSPNLKSTPAAGETLSEEATPSSFETQDDTLPPSPTHVKDNIKSKYFLEMPEDFFRFWDFCQFLQKEKPNEALKDTLGLELVGPFQLLDSAAAKQENLKTVTDYVTQWRFYYDPPEFQSILVGADLKKGYHLGYFRDSPKEMPAFVGCSTESEGCTITPLADNIFASISQLITEKSKKCDPFLKTKLIALRKQMEDWTKENNVSSFLHETQSCLKNRMKKVVAKTFYSCGIVVPINKKTKVGYREIPETDGNLKKIFKKIAESKSGTEQDKNSEALQELVTYVQFANDEMDWGMGLELGLDLLAFGGESFHSTLLHLLNVAYDLLGRVEFATILKAHLKNRRKISSEH